MDGNSAKKSISLETLVIQNVTNVNELKTKLREIISSGRDYEYDISSCVKSLLKSGDHELVFLSVKAIAELSKCETKRETFATENVIEPILSLLSTEITTEKQELIKQCSRALGNLCCDCDSGRDIIHKNNGVALLVSLLEKSIETKMESNELTLLISKALLNYMIGGKEMVESVIDTSLINLLNQILENELTKDDMNDDMVSTCLLILSVINDNIPEYLFEQRVNLMVLRVLEESASLEVTELCLDHLHMQAEHDSVKTLLARRGCVQLLCSRLESLLARESDSATNSTDNEAVVRQACDLAVIVLTGDEAMELLYSNGRGEVYQTMVRWLNQPVGPMLGTAVLAIGNFARRDEYCGAMMREGVFERLLDLFELYHNNSTFDVQTISKLEHAILSALRNLLVPCEPRRLVAAAGRASGALASALPTVTGHHVAYKLMGAARMLAKEESAASLFGRDASFLSAVGSWGARGQYPGAAGEAPRLLAAIVTTARDTDVVKVDGCVTCLVSMLVVSHTIMQNEAILALTLLATKLNTNEPNNYEESLITQLIKSEIGKHISVLIETNCAKMPPEVAENLTAFLELTCKKNEILTDYKESNVADSLKKFVDSRNDFSDSVRSRMNEVLKVLQDMAE